jgi:hypothetical protein
MPHCYGTLGPILEKAAPQSQLSLCDTGSQRRINIKRPTSIQPVSSRAVIEYADNRTLLAIFRAPS